jgi:prepilin-type N-terminal cleavage/methylation domain-containing protein
MKLRTKADDIQEQSSRLASYFDRRSSNSGFTLIESLVAIMVISITLVAITPPIFWATGTRVQNRRAEQALAIAQGEIDRVKAILERGGDVNALDLPKSIGSSLKLSDKADLSPTAKWRFMRSTNLQAPPGTNYNTAEDPTLTGGDNYPPATQYIPVDTDGDGKADFLLQVFRNDGVCAPPRGIELCPGGPQVFAMMVRVYAGIAAQSTVSPLAKDKGSLLGSTGTGTSGFKPLAVLYSKVARPANPNTLERYGRSPVP